MPVRSVDSASAFDFSQRLLAFFFLLFVVSSPSIGSARPPVTGSTDTPESLTTELASADSDYQGAHAADRAALEDRLVRIAEKRQRHLRELVDRDPGRVLRVRTPKSRRDRLPARARDLVEEELATEGQLEVLTEDYVQAHRMKYFLRERTGHRYSLHFARMAPALRSGTHVRMSGVRVGDALALESGGSSVVAVVAPALSNTFGNQRTVVILVNFSNDPANQPYTVGHAQNVVFNQTSTFYQENSFGQTWLTGDVYGWFTIASTSAGCDSWTIATQADAAATAAGVNLSAYARKVYAFPSNGCGWWGLGTVGGMPSRAWVNGSFALQVVGHEMGHNFGLYHAHSMACGTTTIGPICSTSEYGDTADIMGWSTGHFSAFAKERLGWLNYDAQPPITAVSATGLYHIEAYETAGSGPKALKIQKSTDDGGRRTWYYVEYRQAVNTPRGVLFRLGTDASANSSYMLDGSPLTTSFYDAGVPVGVPFVDAEAGVTITALSMTDTGATILVGMGEQECAPAAPEVSMNPSQSSWLTSGTPVTFTMTVTNRDAGACGEGSFSMMGAVPDAWQYIFADPVLTIGPGASVSTTFTVTSPVGAPDGFYPVSSTAALSSTDRPVETRSGSASATYVIAASTESPDEGEGEAPTFSVTASLGSASVSRGSPMTLQANVTLGGAPVRKARVLFTITKPNGRIVTRKPGTNRFGVANAKWKPMRRDPAGTYLVTTLATKDDMQASATEMTFEVR